MAVVTAPRHRRQVERSALWAFVPVVAMLPFALLALFVIWLPVHLVTGLPFVWALIGFAATGPLLFVRRFQVWVLTPVLGARQPTTAEQTAIEPLWNEIVRTNGLPDDRYVVRMLPSDELNAFACGGHLVVVYGITEDAVLVNDPAAPNRGVVPRRYPIEQFAQAWFRHRGAAYILAS